MPRCPYHGNQTPCSECKIQNMGAYAHAPRAPSLAYVITRQTTDPYQAMEKGRVRHRGVRDDRCEPHLYQGVRPRPNHRVHDDQGHLCIRTNGFILRLGPGLWLARPQLQNEGSVSLKDIPGLLRPDLLILLEAKAHVIVIYAVNGDGAFVIGDPAMGKVEMSVPATDYRLKGTGRIWGVWYLRAQPPATRPSHRRPGQYRHCRQ